MVGSRHREAVSLVHAFCGGAELKLLSKYTAYPSRNSNLLQKHILTYIEGKGLKIMIVRDGWTQETYKHEENDRKDKRRKRN